MRVPTVGVWRGTPERGRKPPKLTNSAELRDRESKPSGALVGKSERRHGFGRSVRFWPRPGLPILASITLALAAATSGCGATAPCPTPTAELDSLRTVAEGLESQVDRETAEGRTLEARRDREVERAATAQAALDSLQGVHSH